MPRSAAEGGLSPGCPGLRKQVSVFTLSIRAFHTEKEIEHD